VWILINGTGILVILKRVSDNFYTNSANGYSWKGADNMAGIVKEVHEAVESKFQVSL